VTLSSLDTDRDGMDDAFDPDQGGNIKYRDIIKYIILNNTKTRNTQF
jgi:hypothetical protein